MHVFPYSERPGTAALKLRAESVEAGERHRRGSELQKISERKLKEYMANMVGQKRKVLWEHLLHENPSLMSGLTDNYIRVVAPAVPELLNEVTEITVSGIDPYRDETLLAE